MKKFSPIMIIHLTLMVLLVLLSLISAALVLTGTGIDSPDTMKNSMYLYGAENILTAAALVCGIIYLMKGYSKGAAGYYQAFFMLAFAAWLFSLWLTIQTNAFLHYHLIAVSLTLSIVWAIAVLILAIGLNLGKRNTWILFIILLAADCIMPFLFPEASYFIQVRVVSIISKLALDVTIGLAIKGKYEDKERRGTT